MAITLTEIITVDEYIEVYPQDANVEEDLIQSAINRATITLDAICGGMIAQVWAVTDPTSTYYRTDEEKNYIKQAHAIQAQYNVSRNLDMSAGTESYTSGSNNYNETRPRADMVADEIIYQLLAKGRVYNPNITTNTTIRNVEGVADGFYDPTYDAGDNYVTYNVGDLRYVLMNRPNNANKYAKWDSDGNIVAEEIKVSPTGTSSAVANFITIGGLEYQLGASAGSSLWGRIEGNVEDQTDLVEYITTRLSGYATEQWVEDKHYLTEHQDISGKVDKITTAGYGLYGHEGGTQREWTLSGNPDANTVAFRTTGGVLRVATPTEDNHATTKSYVDNALTRKQDTLVSGTTIKTINGNTLLGSGDIEIGGGSTLVETTYSNLVTLRANSQLVAGCWYRITDYVATTTQENTQATSNQYDIIVLATSTNTLSEEARAIQHSGDTYFANSNLNKWKVWYCLDNDTTRYGWVDSTNGKGVVYRLIDEFDNDIWYDFKLIQVKNTNKSDRFYYLFDNEGVDASLTNSCYSNHFGKCLDSDKLVIGKNICYGGNKFYSNTIGNQFYSNTIGNLFYSNTIGNQFQLNTIGNKFYSNTIGNNFYSNNTTSLSSQPTGCVFPSYINGLITTSTTLTRTSKTTFYIGSDNTLKTLD